MRMHHVVCSLLDRGPAQAPNSVTLPSTVLMRILDKIDGAAGENAPAHAGQVCSVGREPSPRPCTRHTLTGFQLHTRGKAGP